MAGTVGAIFNGALQFGSAIGLAGVSSIETSVEATHGGSHEYRGRAAAFWFLFTLVSPNQNTLTPKILLSGARTSTKSLTMRR